MLKSLKSQCSVFCETFTFIDIQDKTEHDVLHSLKSFWFKSVAMQWLVCPQSDHSLCSLHWFLGFWCFWFSGFGFSFFSRESDSRTANVRSFVCSSGIKTPKQHKINHFTLPPPSTPHTTSHTTSHTSSHTTSHIPSYTTSQLTD